MADTDELSITTTSAAAHAGVTYRRVHYLYQQGLMGSEESQPGSGNDRRVSSVDLACLLAYGDLARLFNLTLVPLPLARLVMEAVRTHPWDEWNMGTASITLLVSPKQYRLRALEIIQAEAGMDTEDAA